jgi:NADH dehydrogenase FAD-containing subunit
MVDRALEEPENISLKVNVVQGLLKLNELIQRSLAELGVPTTTTATVTEVPEPQVKLELDKFAGRTVVAIVYSDGQRMLKSIESMERDCKLNIFNPKLCQAFNAILMSTKEGGG